MSLYRNVRSPRRRPGFTLIEMMVVIAIIGILVSLGAGVVLRFFGTQQEINTKQTLKTLQNKLMQQYNAIIAAAMQENIPSNVQTALQAYAGNDVGNQRLRVIYVTLKIQQAFPMTIAEALSGPLPSVPGLGAYQPYVQYLNKLGITASQGAPLPWESSACLLMAMEKGPKATGGTDTFGAGVVTGASYNGVTLNYFKDGWGNPLFFCRWPYNSDKLNPGGATGAKQQGLNNDPCDKQGQLTDSAWIGSTAYTNNFKAACHPCLAPQNGKPFSYHLTPVIVSPGSDGKLGLNLDPTQGAATVTAADIGDNLYSTLIP